LEGRAGASALMEAGDLDEKEAVWLAGTMFGAGSETTAAALDVFILAMLCYPDVMKKAQAQIDAVVGRSRLPTFKDYNSLPYVRAIMREILRWRSIAPMSMPHRSIKDDVYENHFIPKGTLIFTNVWAMNRDPSIFPDFDTFRPERFLDDYGLNEVIPSDTHNQGHVTYGFGRRICTGKEFANNTIFMTIATTLWAFNLEKVKDESGKEITPDPNDCIDEGLVVRPASFPCAFTPRFEDVPEMLVHASQARRGA